MNCVSGLKDHYQAIQIQGDKAFKEGERDRFQFDSIRFGLAEMEFRTAIRSVVQDQ